MCKHCSTGVALSAGTETMGDRGLGACMGAAAGALQRQAGAHIQLALAPEFLPETARAGWTGGQLRSAIRVLLDAPAHSVPVDELAMRLDPGDST